MKIHRFIIASLFSLFTGSLLNAQDQDPVFATKLPVTFDDPEETYGFRDFGPDPSLTGDPPNTTVVADPDDASNMVARTNRPAGAETWSGVTFMQGPGSLPGLNNGSELKMSARVRAPEAGMPILLKAEASSTGDPPSIFMETQATTTKADEWETLTWDFANPTNSNFNPDFDPFLDRLVLFFNFGAVNAPLQTYYFDDVKFGAPEVLNLPFDFESDTLEYSFTNFEGGVATLIDNPQMNDANPSAKVGQMVKDGGQPWAGTTVATDGPINFGINTWISMDVYSPAAGKTVRFKLEPSGGEAEVDAVTTVANEWETLVFDFTEKLPGEFTNFSLFFGFGEVGDGSADHTYLFDNIRSVPVDGPMKIDLPITFSGSPDDVDYTLTDFGGAVTILGADPFDPTNVVATTQKGPGAETWAGTTMSTPSGLKSPIPFSEDFTGISVRTLSPAAGIPVLLKVEELGRTDNVGLEVIRNTTEANVWETLEFDFNESVAGQFSTPLDLNATYQKISIFFNFGVTGNDGGELIFYWDDVVGPPQGKFVNISTRAMVGTGDNVMIGGFIIGESLQQVLVEAIGPELADRGVANALADPVLTITAADGTVLMTNDNWEDSQGQLVTNLWGGSPNVAAGSASSAAVLTLEPGNYTAKVEGKDGTTGVALVEVYQIDNN